MWLGITSSLIASLLIAGGSLVWRHRGFLSLLRTTLVPVGTVRVSVSALLRVKDDDCYVLFNSPYRPGVYGPPGGVYKFRGSARRTLDRLNFVEQRSSVRQSEMDKDLRGFVPSGRAIGFMRWFSTRQERESETECLRREMGEELRENGHPELVPLTATLTFELVRQVFEPPKRAAGANHRDIRYFEVYDIIHTAAASLDLVRRLIELGRNPSEPNIIAVSGADIRNGRHGSYLVAPQSAFLVGGVRTHPDVPALR